MFRSYYTSAVNNLKKNCLFSVINILGLSVGLATSILIALFVQNETSYDKHWENSKTIYRVQSVSSYRDTPLIREAKVSSLAAVELKNYFSAEIIKTARLMTQDFSGVRYNDTYFSEDISLVDPAFTDLFQFEEIAGDFQSTFTDTNSLAVNEAMAKKIFGNKNPIGEVISVSFFTGGSKEYRISSVFRLAQGNTVLKVAMLGLFDDNLIRGEWSDGAAETFLQLSENVNMKLMSERLPDFINQKVDYGLSLPDENLSDSYSFHLQRIGETYLDEAAWPYLPEDLGNPAALAVFSVISILVLLIACTNYIILATAKSVQRAREVALRKVAGAKISQLLLQFFGELFLITVFALFLALSFVELVLPTFESFTGRNMHLPFSLAGNSFALLIILLIVSVLGGIYPALVAAKFSPSTTLKANQNSITAGSVKVRNFLVLFQFSISTCLIIASSIMYKQLEYSAHLDLGYSPANLIEINIGKPQARKHSKLLIQEMLKLPQVEYAALAGLNPIEEVGNFISAGYHRPGQEVSDSTQTVGYNFFKTFDLPIIAGRYFNKKQDLAERFTLFAIDQTKSDINDYSVILNFSAIKQFGFLTAEEAIGQTIHTDSSAPDTSLNFEIIGIVEDSQFRSPRSRPAPEVYRLAPESSFFLTVRYSNDPQQALISLKKVWNDVVGDIPLESTLIQNRLALVFQTEENQGKLLIVFSLLSVFVSCLGLFGVASFVVEQRGKEICIRKVMGGNLWNILAMLILNFSKPVLFSNFIAWPLAYLTMERWLENFAYRIDLTPVIFISSSLLTLCIAWATVGCTTAIAAAEKPALALRYE